ncbi:Imm43 family immunity protein [Hymenobacter cellulosivorans]|uniref:Immunity protein 43 domain-containing protein n=1 Tax=Hymenobacter cellulosivorans TaxID=2932249 RepID=A0ABY4FGC4_9BACT|nr:hypothetical protein [Hymenobacter cellulosivorans]UOQ55558.1 hypothetical protein MUN80_12540 [Hymenobacter cellulosivorans]
MLYVASRIPVQNTKLGLPIYIERTFTEVFDEKKPMYSPVPRPWWDYNVYRDGVPVPAHLRLPPKLLMVVKTLRRFNPDFFSDRPREWTVSERFRAFLHKRGLLEGYYEESALTVISTSQKELTTQPYYLLRLFRFDNDLVDFEKTPKVVSPIQKTPLTPPNVYYPELVFQQGAKVPPLFFLNDRSYFYSFFCDEETKRAMEQEQFLGFVFYTLEEYIQMKIDLEKQFS